MGIGMLVIVLQNECFLLENDHTQKIHCFRQNIDHIFPEKYLT